jgi:1-acyl-sn-glycerol-3-phosphate acyltransferase
MIRNLRAAFKLTILLTNTLIMLPWALLTHRLARNRLRCGRWWTRAWCSMAWRMLGGQVEVSGEPPPSGGGMIVSNHMSYLDIMLHGSLFGMRFSPKIEMKKWPIVGPMTGLTNPVWIDRNRRNRSGIAMCEMCEALNGEVPLLVYPEGTNGDGSELLPFKTTCFEAATEVNCPIYPMVTYYYPTADGTQLPWVGHIGMFEHFWRVLGLRKFRCRVHIMPAVRPDGRDRKELKEYLRDSMSECYRKLAADAAK